MELELNRSQISCYEPVLDSTVLHEETMEMIVPDACPDILRIVDSAALLCLRSKEAQEGLAELSGTARCTVLYQPENAAGLRKLEVNIPFRVSAEGAGLCPGCLVLAKPRVQAVETRSLNPRKVLVRLNLVIALQAWAPAVKILASSAVCPEEAGVEQLRESKSLYLVSAVQEKPFTFSDDIILASNRPAAEEILRSRVNLLCNESKIIGNKLIFKGEADLRVCYRAQNGDLCNADYELPFSQIMDAGGGGEEADCNPEVLLTDFSCALAGEDGRTLAVSLGLLGHAVVREERSVELLTDIYSNTCALSPELQNYESCRLVERNLRRQGGRELLETAVTARSILDASATVLQVTQSREEGHWTFTAETALAVLYLGENNEAYGVKQLVRVPCNVDLPEGTDCSCSCKCVGEVFATPSTGGVELRFDTEFRYLAVENGRLAGVSAVERSELLPGEGGPSVILRLAGEARLWDLAKTYRTTIADIVRANDLSEEEPLGTKMLLIPRKRA
ncbi:MAG: DUF3794 domain-containing protein [Pseudoflavonifractor sp.]